jgi:hypothetical protein
VIRLFFCWLIRLIIAAALGFIYVAFFGTKGGGDPMFNTSEFGALENIAITASVFGLIALMINTSKICDE